MKRIEQLTEEQTARLAEFRDKWLSIGLATGPCDRLAMEQAVNLAYEAAGMKTPQFKIWLQSPLAGCIGAHLLLHWKGGGAQVWDQVWDQVGDQVWDQVWDQVGDQVGDQVWDQVGDQVGDQVWAQVRDQVRAQVGDQVWAQVRDQVRAQVGDQVWAQVRDQVGDQVWDQVGAQVGDQVGDQVYRCGYGQHDSSWLAFYDFFLEVCGLESCGKLKGLSLLSSCGWWWPFRDAVILTERPIELHRDSQWRLHNMDGAAIRYPDGFSVYASHGLRLPAWIIEEKERITTGLIDGERNAELRRVMLEIFGQERYIRESGAKLVNRDACGALWRKELTDDEPLVMVELLNSTPEPDGSVDRDEALTRFDPRTPVCHDGMMMELAQVPASLRFKTYMLRVPPNMRSAKEAVAWSGEMTADEYELAYQS